jgi:hypothetical protein
MSNGNRAMSAFWLSGSFLPLALAFAFAFASAFSFAFSSAFSFAFAFSIAFSRAASCARRCASCYFFNCSSRFISARASCRDRWPVSTSARTDDDASKAIDATSAATTRPACDGAGERDREEGRGAREHISHTPTERARVTSASTRREEVALLDGRTACSHAAIGDLPRCAPRGGFV